MRYITETALLEERLTNFSAERRNIKEASSQARLSIFLSHSHKDRKFVEGIIDKFAKLGISIYVDWNDTAMPRITNRKTAALIKERMRSCDLFVVLATANANASKWVPWETGVADQMKGEERVLVVPVADPSGKFTGAEYMGLYRRIGFDDIYPFLNVFEADTNASVGLASAYFSRYAHR